MPPYKEFWPEAYVRENRAVFPPWKDLEAQAVHVRADLIRKGIEINKNNPFRRQFGTVPNGIPPEQFDINNIHCFSAIPSVGRIRESITSAALRVSRVPKDETEEYIQQVRHELANCLYGCSMWNHYGRRVYVLDQTTYTLLSETALPDFPVSMLAVPEHSFFLALPENSFDFGVWNLQTRTEDISSIEGLLISIDKIDPDNPSPRELSFVVIGRGKSLDDRNIAYITVGLGPDAKLSEIRFADAHRRKMNSYGASTIAGAYHLGVVVPRVILGFLLYLQSEHPDIEPVDPTPRRSFNEIKSEKQRQAALQNQTDKLKGFTRLPLLYVGRHLMDSVDNNTKVYLNMESARLGESANRTLDHPVWVRGHWKMQPYGKERKLRKSIWIRPYMKGPDVAEWLRTRAAKVQKAQPSTKAKTEVTPLRAS